MPDNTDFGGDDSGGGDDSSYVTCTEDAVESGVSTTREKACYFGDRTLH